MTIANSWRFQQAVPANRRQFEKHKNNIAFKRKKPSQSAYADGNGLLFPAQLQRQSILHPSGKAFNSIIIEVK